MGWEKFSASRGRPSLPGWWISIRSGARQLGLSITLNEELKEVHYVELLYNPIASSIGLLPSPQESPTNRNIIRCNRMVYVSCGAFARQYGLGIKHCGRYKAEWQETPFGRAIVFCLSPKPM